MDSLEALLRDMDAEVAVRGIAGYRDRLRRLVVQQNDITTGRDGVTHDDLMRGVENDWDTRQKIANAADALAASYRKNGRTTTPDSYRMARRTVDAIRRAPHPDRAEPDGYDDVRREDVVNLPEGSLVVAVSSHTGQPALGAGVHPVKGNMAPLRLYDKYRVLYRAPESPLRVGEEITSPRQLRRAKVGTILRTTPAGVGVYTRRYDGTWSQTGTDKSLTDDNLPVGNLAVVYVPEEG